MAPMGRAVFQAQLATSSSPSHLSPSLRWSAARKALAMRKDGASAHQQLGGRAVSSKCIQKSTTAVAGQVMIAIPWHAGEGKQMTSRLTSNTHWMKCLNRSTLPRSINGDSTCPSLQDRWYLIPRQDGTLLPHWMDANGNHTNTVLYN